MLLGLWAAMFVIVCCARRACRPTRATTGAGRGAARDGGAGAAGDPRRPPPAGAAAAVPRQVVVAAIPIAFGLRMQSIATPFGPPIRCGVARRATDAVLDRRHDQRDQPDRRHGRLAGGIAAIGSAVAIPAQLLVRSVQHRGPAAGAARLHAGLPRPQLPPGQRLHGQQRWRSCSATGWRDGDHRRGEGRDDVRGAGPSDPGHGLGDLPAGRRAAALRSRVATRSTCPTACTRSA